MNSRPDSEIESSFRPVEQALDAMLEESRAFIEREGVILRDASNRTGFDGSGFPSFNWSYHFAKRTPYRSEIKQITAHLWYGEPIYKEDARTIEVTTVAEIFQTGKESRVRESKKDVYTVEGFLKMNMEQIITNCFADAGHVLAKY